MRAADTQKRSKRSARRTTHRWNISIGWRPKGPWEDELSLAVRGCDPSDIANWSDARPPSARESPIFVVGFPRSGTTLLEQMLDAHPSLQSMDEQPFLQQAVDRIVAWGIDYPGGLATLTQAQIDELRAEYLARSEEKMTPRGNQRLVDKNPLNLLRLPMIHRLFPQARIIVAIRHPCDVLLSCFSQDFRAPEFARLCRDLPALTGAYSRAFDFWYSQSGLLAPACIELRYEDLVGDPASAARALCSFLELPWHDAMLDPANNALLKGYIGTPSYAQVVEPISGKAIGRWRNYSSHFTALLPQLTPYLARWHYGASR